ncbi:MAG: preprotein translocase subunit SecY [Candidatus Margulisiibacteriota bacterium]
MASFISAFKSQGLQKKLWFTLGLVFVYRLGTHIPLAGVDLSLISQTFSSSGILSFFNLFSGGALSRFSVFALGILPYINASIIMQLLSVVSPSLKELNEEGDYGRKKVAQYTRYLTIVLAFFQAIVMSVGFRNFVNPDIPFALFLTYSVIALVAGVALVLWISELITEYGIGNGASVLIFIGIVAQMPNYVHQTYVLVQGGTSILNVLMLVLIFMVLLVGIVYVQEAYRKIPVEYVKRATARGAVSQKSSYIPLKLIQSGVMPIIFASAVMQFPLMIFQYVHVEAISNFMALHYRYDSVFYNVVLCLLIFFFAYFYTAITFNPEELSDNIKKHGGFIMGIRPGKPTVEFLDKTITSLTLFGAVFLSVISLIPMAGASLTGVTSFVGLGGTALLIMVGVAMDLLRQIQSYVISSKYEGLLR